MEPLVFNNYSWDGIKIHFSEPTDDKDYMVKAHEFLQKLMKEFARLSRLSYRPRLGAVYFPYIYTERRLDSVVLPALSYICDGVVLTELPVERKISPEDDSVHHGRVDYWCIYKGYTFVIEMKGTRAIFKGNIVNTREHSVKGRWRKMIEQLINVEEDCRNTLIENTKGIIRLGLHFITSVADIEPDWDDIAEYRETIDERMERMRRDIAKRFNYKLDYTPNFAAAWLIPDDMISSNPDATYPGVMLFAKVFEDLPHENDD
jgi:hypothetical protein